MAGPTRKRSRDKDCPYLQPHADFDVHVVPAYCRDPGSGLTSFGGFWEYWNRCTTIKHIRCPLYRRYQRQRAPGLTEARSSLRRSG